MQDRREFFRSLIAGGATVAERPGRRNHREHHADNVVYHGPMLIPERIAAIIADHPAIKRTMCRHLVSRYAEAGWTWLFRCQIPDHRRMVGDIRRTITGQVRVCCWSAADPERYTRNDEPAAIISRGRLNAQ
ncbi:MAG TPA: hypothetical protein VKF63_12835 [Terracidiphilus sp.]|nr:hypothetical protein [Terracidiphilus sp.]